MILGSTFNPTIRNWPPTGIYFFRSTVNSGWQKFSNSFDKRRSEHDIWDLSVPFWLPSLFLNVHKVFTDSGIENAPALLLAFNSAEYGKQIEDSSEDEIIASAIASLDKIHPFSKGKGLLTVNDLKSKPLLTKWSDEPFTRGSYSYPSISSTPTDYERFVSKNMRLS